MINSGQVYQNRPTRQQHRRPKADLFTGKCVQDHCQLKPTNMFKKGVLVMLSTFKNTDFHNLKMPTLIPKMRV